MPNVLLGVSGSVAAIRTPALHQLLTGAGHTVKVVATNASLYFFDPAALGPMAELHKRDPEVVILDEDEWAGFSQGRSYRPGDPVLHIELRRWADILLIAPLDANTLAKLAGGIADNCLTCVWRAWDLSRPIVLAPAMNTLMWEHPFTARHFRQIAADALAAAPPDELSRDELLDWINLTGRGLRVVPPQEKRLACGDVGMGAMGDLERIVSAVNSLTA